ncbi:MAG: HigA family addiction module antitoxin [Cyanobacteria bacterium P01_F01_bin.150]
MTIQHVTSIHPGEVLQDELEELDISPEILAEHIKVPITNILDICSGQKDIDATLAIKLSRALGASPLFWLNLQNNWELSQIDESAYQDIKPVVAA